MNNEKQTKSSSANNHSQRPKNQSKKMVGAHGEEWRIRFFSNDHRILDSLVKSIVDAAKKSTVVDISVVMIPTTRKLFTVLRSPTIYKESRDQYKVETKKRLVILTPKVGGSAADILREVVVPAGVEMTFEVINKKESEKAK